MSGADHASYPRFSHASFNSIYASGGFIHTLRTFTGVGEGCSLAKQSVHARFAARGFEDVLSGQLRWAADSQDVEFKAEMESDYRPKAQAAALSTAVVSSCHGRSDSYLLSNPSAPS